MSHWTYVNGLIKVSSLGCNTQADSDYAVVKAIERLPKVTGSERDMTVTIVPIDEVTSSCWPEEVEFKEEYYLVVHGDLRDRCFDETLREFNKFMNRLAKRIWVLDVMVEITNGFLDFNKKYIISDHYFYGTLID